MQVPAADPTLTHVTKDLVHTRPLLSCRFDPSGKFVFAGCEDNRIWRFDIASAAKTELAGHDSWVRAIGFSKDGQTLLTGGYEGKLLWWPVAAEKPAPTRTVQAHQGWIRSLAVSPDGTLVATAGNDLVVRIWKTEDGSKVHELAGHPRHVYNLAFHPEGKRLASGDLMANVIEWEVDSGKEVRRLKFPPLSKFDPGFMADIGGTRGMNFSPDGKQLVLSGITNVSNAFAGVGNPIALVANWEDGKEIVQYGSKANVNGVCWNAAVHPAGFVLGASGGGGGGHLFFWKGTEKAEFHTLNLGNSVRDMHLAADNIHIAIAHVDGHVRICKMGAKA
jgi:WD40 repeat protein